MDGIHDLGGRQGFGPIRWQADEKSDGFHEKWEGRAWAICMCMLTQFWQDQTGWTLDWSRHVIERIAPADYLVMNYFDKWTQHLMAILIDDGVATVQDFVDGRSHGQPPARPLVTPSPMTATVAVRPARYAAGDRVIAKRNIASMHTRLPGFTRGHKGVIDASHGPEIFPDASARGDTRKEQLYTVRFEAAELWPEAEGRRDGIYVDLWESYLEPA